MEEDQRLEVAVTAHNEPHFTSAASSHFPCNISYLKKGQIIHVAPLVGS